MTAAAPSGASAGRPVRRRPKPPTGRADGTPRPHAPSGWLLSLLTFVAGVLYVCTFWGTAIFWWSRWLPAALDELARFVRTQAVHWHETRFGTWLLFQFAVGLIPMAIVMAFRRTPGELGLGRFNALGARLVLASIATSVPFGLLLMRTGGVRVPRGLPETVQRLGELLSVVPEHALICGLFVAVMLPDRRLPATVPVAAVEGPWPQRGFRWLGLAQPRACNAGALAWFGLTAESLVAVVASGVLFGLAHVGKADVTEVGLSLPGGVAVAYVTLRSRSIWPAVIAHLTMNVIPMAMSAAVTG